jgi:hypothetical protein
LIEKSFKGRTSKKSSARQVHRLDCPCLLYFHNSDGGSCHYALRKLKAAFHFYCNPPHRLISNFDLFSHHFHKAPLQRVPLPMHSKRSVSSRLKSLHWSVYLAIMAASLLVAVLATTLTARATSGMPHARAQHDLPKPSDTPVPTPLPQPQLPTLSPMPPMPPMMPDIPLPHIGKLELISTGSGVPAMHAAAMPDGRVVFLDKVEDYTQLRLPNGQYAYSCMYDPDLQTIKPLSYSTNAFCCGGSFLPDGRLITVGGNGPLEEIDPTVKNGFDGIRWLGQDDDS